MGKNKTIARVLAIISPAIAYYYIGEGIKKAILFFFIDPFILPWIFGIWDIWKETEDWT